MSLRLYAQNTLEMTAFTGCPIHKGYVGKHPEAPHPPRMQVGKVFVRFCVLKRFFFCWSWHRKKPKKTTTGKQNLQSIPLRGWLWLGLTNGAGIKHSTAEAESSALLQVDLASVDLPVGARTTSACLKHAYGALNSSRPAAILAFPIATRSGKCRVTCDRHYRNFLD